MRKREKQKAERKKRVENVFEVEKDLKREIFQMFPGNTITNNYHTIKILLPIICSR